ncbi:DnaB-like helicase C-terminal domain-containing protein [Pseudomonas brassicacearum]|uniref:DnaB-like helicase C-terminal domain-containing protein n=1 Tax=Pseudomonas brassicacearum TaxID=930166 RepID=UPI0007207449|nr:DnaB-like helicase C-terminal domain-containing protein [Pseudomonas brassicacearum]ALQ01467.1 Replicative DNA helicase [Pseudomonas brassicacearum]
MIADRPLVAPEAELGVIGALMHKPELIESIGGMVSPDDFFDTDASELYAMILAARSAGRPVDSVSLSDIRNELSSGELTIVKASEIMRDVPSAANGIEYARIVVERSKARKIANIGQSIIDMASHARPLAGIIADAQEAVLALNSEDDEPDVISLREALGPVIDEMDARFNGEGINGHATGLSDLDEILQGLRGSHVIIIAGRPGTGKTTLGLGIAENLTIRNGKSALVFSLEMSGKELSKRSLASSSAVTLGNIDTGKAMGDDDQITKIKGAVSRMHAADLRICQKGGLPLSRIRNIARFQHKAKPLDLIVIDYIGLIAPEAGSRQQNRNLELGAISRGIKGMAKELDVPVIVLAQLNRSIETRSSKKPQMSDLRDSGEIEQDADIIMIAHRDANSDLGRSGVTEIDVVKHRHASVGHCMLQHQGEFARFVNYAGRREQQQEASAPPPRRNSKSLLNSFNPAGGF